MSILRPVTLLRRALLLGLLLALPSAPALAQVPSTTTTTKPPQLGTGSSDDLILSPQGALPTDPGARLDELQRRIATAEAQEGDLLAQIDASESRRAQLDSVVADLQRQKQGLDAQMAVLGHDLDRVTSAYITAEREVSEAAARLGDAKDRTKRRALHMYKEGPAGIVNFVLGARDLEDASTRLGYVKRVLDFDRNTLDRLDAAQKDYSARSSRLDELKSEKLSAVGRVEGVRREIAGNLNRQQKARDDAAAEAQHKRSVLAKVEADRASWQTLVARQQQDSMGITDLLARYQTGQPLAPGVIAGFFTFPVIGEITSLFGWRVHPIFGTSRFHAGIDIAVNEGTPIAAPADGTVVYAGWMGGYGNATVIDHGQRVATLYGHQSGFAVSPGDAVHRGQTIGYVGSTGYSTGPHLHFEVRLDGEPTDPGPWLAAL